MTPTTSIILLAAGQSTRFGPENKLLQPFGEHETLLEATIDRALKVATDDIVLVTGHDQELIAPIADKLPIRVVHNPHYAEGMGSSIKAGVQTIHPGHAIMIWPADMPLIRPETVGALLEKTSPSIIIRPTHLGNPGHPVLFGILHRDALLHINDAGGAQEVLEARKNDVVRVSVTDAGVIQDFDTPEDFPALSPNP